MAKILIVDDEQAINDLIYMNLKTVGHTCVQVYSGETAISKIKNEKFDLCILDIMLPNRDGFSIIKEMIDENVKVIFVSAKDNVVDKVKGLELGAEDYITKPFEAMELIARVNTVLKRTEINSKGVNSFILEDVEIRLDEHKVLINGGQVELTAKEFELLRVFIKNINIALSREKLLELVWGYDYLGETRTVDVHIQKLRNKLHWEKYIQTVYKIGYRFEVEENEILAKNLFR